MKLFWTVALIIAFLGYRIPDRPERLKINGQEWRVEWPEVLLLETPFGAMEYAGLTRCETRTILISRDEDPADWPEILLHETAHALTCGPDNQVHNELYSNPPEGDHPGIEFLAQHWLGFIRDNPEAVRWIEARR
jgi:hypothetical protein